MSDLAEIQAVVFDFDGVIINSLKLHFGATKAIAKEFNKQFPFKKLEKYATEWTGWEKFFKTLRLNNDCQKKARKIFTAIYVANEDRVKLYGGIKVVLEKLHKAGIKTGIATNHPKKVVESIMKKHGIAKWVDAFVSGKKIKRFKPHPDIVLACLKKLHVAPRNAAFVGDMLLDMQAGKNAGTKTVAVTWGWHSREMLEKAKPDLIVNKPIEILKILVE